jgi:triphosphoribosyl-dephospho-CoA synthase
VNPGAIRTTAAARPAQAAAHFDSRATDSAKKIRRAAVRALLDEVETFPKPGLVSRVDRGSHDDMDATTFFRSALALRHYFAESARAGARGASFETLRLLGVSAETRMNAATGRVNTHRGAIFTLGLLAAAAGTGARPDELGEIVRRRWGDALKSHRRVVSSHGSDATRTHGAGGALAEAARGFPHLFGTVLPAYRGALARGAPIARARVHGFFASLATLDDTNLLHRGGAEGLAYARREATDYLAAGGVFAPDAHARELAIHRGFCARRLSPGGSADLLAAALFVEHLRR